MTHKQQTRHVALRSPSAFCVRMHTNGGLAHVVPWLFCAVVYAITVGCASQANTVSVSSPRISTVDGWVFNSGLLGFGEVVTQARDGNLRGTGTRIDFGEPDKNASDPVESQVYSVKASAELVFGEGVPPAIQKAFRTKFNSYFQVDLRRFRRYSLKNPDAIVGANPNHARLKDLVTEEANRNCRHLLVTGWIAGDSEFQAESGQSVDVNVPVTVDGFALRVDFQKNFRWKSTVDGAPAFVELCELRLVNDDIKCVPVNNVWEWP